jgi:hypothetical protein
LLGTLEREARTSTGEGTFEHAAFLLRGVFTGVKVLRIGVVGDMQYVSGVM